MIHFCRFFSLAILFLCISLALNAVEEETPPFIVFSPPKCGTHLAGAAIEKITGKTATYALTVLGENDQAVLRFIHKTTKNGSFVVAHNLSQKQLAALVKKKYKIIFTFRDPRDHLVSVSDWFFEGQWPWLKVSQIKDPEKQIEELITGERFGWTSFRMIKSRFLSLRAFSKNSCKLLPFENLIGSQGNGSDKIQMEQLIDLAQFLNLPLTNEEALLIGGQIYGDSPTFRFGQVGRWKEYFSPHHIALFKEKYGKILIHLGYEKDLKW